MDVRLDLPQTPVRLAPGAETRVPVEVHNASTSAVAVRVAVSGGRTAGWARLDPATVTVPAGSSSTADIIFRPPGQHAVGAALIPFTVRADEVGDGDATAWASGLVTVATPDRLAAGLEAAGAKATDEFILRLRNQADTAVTVRVRAVLDPPAGGVVVEPDIVQVAAGVTATAVVRAAPRRPPVGAPATYAVIVSVFEVMAADDAPPLLTLTGTGTRRPRMSSRTAAALAAALLVLATLAAAFLGDRIKAPGRAAPSAVVVAGMQHTGAVLPARSPPAGTLHLPSPVRPFR